MQSSLHIAVHILFIDFKRKYDKMKRNIEVGNALADVCIKKNKRDTVKTETIKR